VGDTKELETLGHIPRMELLTTRDGKEVWLHQIERPFVFDPPFPGRHFVAIVFSNDETVVDSERQIVSRALFSSGCRYGVFAGHDCDDWELALDLACIESAPDCEASDEAFTMTTSHKDESVEDIIFFGLMNTSFDAHDFDRFLILFIGPRTGLHDDVESSIRSVWYGNHAA
jgi:hypothetical protein